MTVWKLSSSSTDIWTKPAPLTLNSQLSLDSVSTSKGWSCTTKNTNQKTGNSKATNQSEGREFKTLVRNMLMTLLLKTLFRTMTKITALQSLRLKTSCRLWEESFKVSLTRWNMTLKDLGNPRLGSRFKLNLCSHKFGLLTSPNKRNWANGSGILLVKMSRQLGYPTKSLRPRGLSSSDTRTRMRCATSRSRFQTESKESTLWNSTTSQEKLDTSNTRQTTLL